LTFHQATLPNGLTVIFERNPRARSVSAGFFIKTGSRDETSELAGVSHFLEHMVFKGTERRDALTVNRDFDRIGARHNAQTSEEDTIFHATCLPEFLPDAVDLLADILRPRLDAADFETEKQVIIEEIHMYNDNPMMVAYEAAKATHFAGHPLGGSVLGTVDSIAALTVDQMRGYFEQRYGPRNIVLAASGKFDWEDLLRLAEDRCGGWSGPEARRVAEPHRGVGGPKAVRREDDHQETVIGVADAPGVEEDDRYAAALLATVLGDHTGSRLYWALVDPGYADAADLSYQDYQTAGAYYTFLSCEPEDTAANLERIADVYREVMERGVGPEELERARNKVLARVVIRGERPMGRMMPLGYNWIYRGEHISIDDEVNAYRKVTPEAVLRVLERYPPLPMTVVDVGPAAEPRSVTV